MLRVENMYSTNGNKVPNQFIIADGQKLTFQSYNSTIIEIDRRKKVLTVFPDYDYSMTTGKYRNAFLADNGFYNLSNLKALKQAIADGFYRDYKVVLKKGG